MIPIGSPISPYDHHQIPIGSQNKVRINVAPVLSQVSRLLSGVHWLPVVRCAFVACVISLVEWSILSAVHSHERDDNVALVVSMILVSFCFQCTNRMIHGACPHRSSIKLAFWQCC